MQNPAKAKPRPTVLLSAPSPAGLKSAGLKSSKRAMPPGNGSSVSVNEMPPPSTPTTGIRAQLGHLLPRHAYFRASVIIHEISSVPFLGGEFAVRWKFKGVQEGTRHRLLERVRGRAGSDDKRLGIKTPPISPDDDDRRFKGPPLPGDARFKSYNTNTSPVTIASVSSTLSSQSSDAAGEFSTRTTEWGHLSVTAIAPMASSSSSTMMPISGTSGTNTPVTFDAGSAAPARGATPFLRLVDHSVKWSQTLDNVLKFHIDRETSNILPNPLKLVVFQRVIPGEPNGKNPQNPRLGAVYLNLAEYVGQGSIERRYLLMESKTNAILKLTIEVEYLGGESNFIPPPLAQGEILNEIAGFLEKEGVKKRPRALDLYGPYRNQEELETDLLGGLKSTARGALHNNNTARSQRKIFDVSSHETETEDDTTSFEEHETGGDEVGVAFDVQRLPVAYGTKTTEILIDSLFNPVTVYDMTDESPFTIYEPPSPPDDSPPRNNNNTRRGPLSEENIGLGLSGVSSSSSRGRPNVTILPPPPPPRQMSYEEASDSASSEHSHTTSSSLHDDHHHHHHHGHPLEPHARRVQAQSQNVVVKARSTPGGRIVVDNNMPHADGGVRGWWRRNISKSHLPMGKGPGPS